MRIPSLILRIVAILAAVVSGFLFFLSKGELEKQHKEIQQMRTTFQSSQDNLQSKAEEVLSLQEKLSIKTKSLETAQSKFEITQSKLNFKEKEIRQLRNELEQMTINASKLEETADRLLKELIQTERSLVSVSKESQLAQLKERIDDLLVTNSILRQEIGRLEALQNN